MQQFWEDYKSGMKMLFVDIRFVDFAVTISAIGAVAIPSLAIIYAAMHLIKSL